jgi:hypothetical protein
VSRTSDDLELQLEVESETAPQHLDLPGVLLAEERDSGRMS